MTYRHILMALLLCTALPLAAQHKSAAKAARPAKAAPRHSARYTAMLPATAKVMFTDSVVVAKHDFLAHLPLCSEAGSVTTLPGRHGADAMPLTVYQNELADRRIIADGDTAASHLAAQTLVGGQWSEPLALAGIDTDVYRHACAPFMASDGTTLFFAAKGEHSLGGYDIFMTTYDADSQQWYEPQNYGLPFNSEANEYFLAVDDLDSLGWLVTDRRQAPDSVCIYTFELTPTRRDFQADDVSDERLAAYADISAIRATWAFGNRKAAQRRLAAMTGRAQQAAAPTLRFAVSDSRVVSDPTQWRSAKSPRLYAQLTELQHLADATRQELDSCRRQYAAQPDRRAALRPRIANLESQLSQQLHDSHDLAKKIRNLENQ